MEKSDGSARGPGSPQRGETPKGPDQARGDLNQRLFEAARNAFALKMAALHDLSLDLSLADDVDELCRRAVDLGQRVLGFDRIGIWFVDSADPALLYGSFGTDEEGLIRDERGVQYRRSAESLPEGFYEGKEPVYYMGSGPCFNERHEVVGIAEKALALLWDGRKVIGEIWVDNLVTKRSIDGGSLELLVRYARIVGSLSSLKRVQAELMLLASTDALTGVVNRRTVLVVLEKQFSLAARKDDDIAVIFCDIDGLKAVNDNLGHAAGDEFIKLASSALLDSLRDCDTVGRLGGDEFLIVLPDCDAAGAALIDARIEAALVHANAGPKPVPIALSRGIATRRELVLDDNGSGTGDIGTTAQDLVDLADRRMYEAKRGSRK
jgi:diguanylate cyclase (GGDEF)-like protein